MLEPTATTTNLKEEKDKGERMGHIVVTGFGPFGSYGLNASWEAVRTIRDLGLWKDKKVDLVFEEIPVSYDFVQSLVPHKWEKMSTSEIQQQQQQQQQQVVSGPDKQQLAAVDSVQNSDILGKRDRELDVQNEAQQQQQFDGQNEDKDDKGNDGLDEENEVQPSDDTKRIKIRKLDEDEKIKQLQEQQQQLLQQLERQQREQEQRQRDEKEQQQRVLQQIEKGRQGLKSDSNQGSSLLAVVHVGVSHLARMLTLERTGRNLGYNKNDVCGRTPLGGICVSSGEDVLSTNFDVKRLSAYVNSPHCCSPVSSECSTDAGRYLCDFTFYKSLHSTRGRALFVHVPDLGRPFAKEQLAQGLCLVLQGVVEQLLEKEEEERP